MKYLKNNIVIILLIMLLFIVFLACFNKEVYNIYYRNNIEHFETKNENGIGLKWIYVGTREPNGTKINNDKLRTILKSKYVSPVIINEDELFSLDIKDISYDTYIDVEGKFYKPYDNTKIYLDMGLRWRSLGSITESYVTLNYKEILNVSIREAIKEKVLAKSYENIEGENLISFTRRELSNIIGDSKLTYDSYIIVDNNKFQPYYELDNNIRINKKIRDINNDTIKENGLDASFAGSTNVSMDDSIYKYKPLENYEFESSNQEFSLNTQYLYYKQSNDDLDKNINDPIDDSYLPYSESSYKDDVSSISQNSINEYIIIDIYKSLLNRQPTGNELRKNLQDFYEKNIDEEKLKLQIYNSTEYKMIVKMQSNDIEPGLVTQISNVKLMDKLEPMYIAQFNKEIPFKMKVPIKQCYIHLQYNDYLFKAFLMHDKYSLFEAAVMREYTMNDKKLLEIFNNHFVLYELRLIANGLKRQDVVKRKSLETPIALQTDATKNTPNSIESKELDMKTKEYISEIIQNSDKAININITLNDKDKNMSKPYSSSANNGSGGGGGNNGSGGGNNGSGSGGGNNGSGDGNNGSGSGGGNNNGDLMADNTNRLNQSELVIDKETGRMIRYSDIKKDKSYISGNRIYNPISYKQHYRGDPLYRPNVCSYGTKQVVNPVMIINSNEFQGTPLKEAIENTQVGSIMPKFEYREYEELN